MNDANQHYQPVIHSISSVADQTRKRQWFQINHAERPPQRASTVQFLTATATTIRTHWLEIIGILLLLAVFSGTPAPGVNESHYLTKARHFWNPGWCPHDLFLASSDAHYAFYLVAGWPAQLVSLDSYAWFGRIVSWFGFAIAWIHLNQALGIRRGYSCLTVVMFLLLNETFHLAGEWVIGGFEAKSLAYLFVIFALSMLLRDKFPWYWPVLGVACAFHVVVGMWGSICLAVAMIGTGKRWSLGKRGWPDVAGIQRWQLVLAVGLFVTLFSGSALWAWRSAFTGDAAVTALANEIQVHQRLSHHLLFANFLTPQIARFAILVTLWLIMTRWVPWPPSFNRLHVYCGTSLLISLLGLILSAQATPTNSSYQLANGLLKLYWFRFSDFAIPLGVSLMCGKMVGNLLDSSGKRQRGWGMFSLFCLFTASLFYVVEQHRDRRPGADRAALPSYFNDDLRTWQTFENWKRVCHWIETNTDDQAVFLTPIEQQTFKWYAQRSEMACWKDMPQDAASIVEWWNRVKLLRTIESQYPGGALDLNVDQLRHLSDEFGVTHLLITQSREDVAGINHNQSNDRPQWKRIYPTSHSERSTYAVYEIVR